jgi:hypothetical protein
VHRVSQAVFGSALPPKPVPVLIAGGAAVHLYTGARVSKDLDAEFLARMLRPAVSVTYVDEAGALQSVHLDQAYSATLGLMHEDYVERSQPAPFGAPGFELRLLAPVDLAISKLARWAAHDQNDVASLAQAGLLDADELDRLANQALSYYVGNTTPVKRNIVEAVELVRARATGKKPPGMTP